MQIKRVPQRNSKIPKIIFHFDYNCTHIYNKLSYYVSKPKLRPDPSSLYVLTHKCVVYLFFPRQRTKLAADLTCHFVGKHPVVILNATEVASDARNLKDLKDY